MKSFVQKGGNLTLPATTVALTGGQALLVGAAIFGIVEADAAIGEDYTLVRHGVFSDQPKATGAAWAGGDILYWDNTAKNFTKTAAGNTRVGAVVAVAQTGDTTGTVVLGVDTI